jgi:hypothetical protein
MDNAIFPKEIFVIIAEYIDKLEHVRVLSLICKELRKLSLNLKKEH